MDKIIFTFLLIAFPLGQLVKFGIFNIFDVLVVILAILTLLKSIKYPNWYPYFLSFIFFGLFSWTVNIFIIKDPLVFKGLLYLIRLFSYSFVAVYVFNYLKSKHGLSIRDKKEKIINSLLSVSIASTLFGWIQYLVLPDTRFLKDVGWDDHLYRMVGTFFDPAFLALIILLGIVIALYQKKTKTFLFLLISLAFTYSRATYLGLGLFLIFKRKFLPLVIFAVVVLFLPKMLSEGTDFGRVASNINKLSNYEETLSIIKKSPAIGVGYNNFCPARIKYLNDDNTLSHSCFGSDSSILFILATTGVIGFVLFLSFIFRVPNSYLVSISFLLIMVHGLFTNSLFYPHVMFWMFTLLGSGSEVDRKRG
ncbi:MAG TPA: O-antigen ligase family protein [Patescibacteria group bacterium]|nr:O-antigen ligase family protein [Patescibacteria group bacterium]